MPMPYTRDENDDSHSGEGSKMKKLLSNVQAPLNTHRINFTKSTSSSSINSDNSLQRSASNKSTSSNSSEKVVLNEDGFQEPKKILFPKARIQELMNWKASSAAGAGLHNHGNTCFLNSVIQCITHTPPLTNYLLSKEHSRSCKIVGFCMMCILEKHVARAASGGAISPAEVVQNLRKIAPGFRPGRQEDAHEFLRFVIEGAQKSCLSHLQKDKSISPREAQTTVIGNIFGGYLQSQVKCSECNYESNTYDPFMDLSVDLGDKVDTLAAALGKFIKPEILDARNMYMCSKCKKRVRAQKRMRIYQAPPVLTIQLKRFSFFQMFGGKINRPIKFESRLNLEPYMVKPSPDGPMVYNLYGVLVHLGGSTNSGHYYSFVKAPNGEWYKMDDSSVSRESLGNVLQQKAYILFYVRATNNSRPATPSSAANSAPTTPTSSAPTTPTSSSTTPTSSNLNGHGWDSLLTTYNTDPKAKMNGKPILMSNQSLQKQQQHLNQQNQQPQKQPQSSPSPLLQKQSATLTLPKQSAPSLPLKSSNPPHPQSKADQPLLQSKQDPHHPQSQSDPPSPHSKHTSAAPHLKQLVPRALWVQAHKKQAAHPPPQDPNTPSPLSQNPQTSQDDQRSPRSLSRAQSDLTPLVLGHDLLASPNEQPAKKRRLALSHDHSVLSIGGHWTVSDIKPVESESAETVGKKKEADSTPASAVAAKKRKEPEANVTVVEPEASKKRKEPESKESKKKEANATKSEEGKSEEKPLSKNQLKKQRKKAAKAAREAASASAGKTEEVKDTWKNLFDQGSRQASQAPEIPNPELAKQNGKKAKENGHANGKINGKHVDNANGANGTNGVNGSMNGKHAEKHANGKTNGKHVESATNGKMNGNHVESSEHLDAEMNGTTEPKGKTNAKENGKASAKFAWKLVDYGSDSDEKDKPQGKPKEQESVSSSKGNGFGPQKFTVTDGVSVTAAKAMATDFLKRMETAFDATSIYGQTVAGWDDDESTQAARKKALNKKKEKVDSLFREKDEWDIEYDLGKQKKVKTTDIFSNKTNVFQSLADQRAKDKLVNSS